MEPRISIVALGVSDLPRSIRFYRDGLHFPTTAKDNDSIAFFSTTGARIALYPLSKLAEDIGPHVSAKVVFPGITLGHCVRKKEEVAELLALAEKVGGRIEKPAQDVFWGGHSGYFSDPDGYYWEVAWFSKWEFDDHGNVIV